MTRSKTGIAAIGLTALLVSAQALAALFSTEEFESGETRPVSIAVLPVEASIVRTKLVDTESLVDESTQLGADYAGKIAALLESKGYAVQVLDPQRINADVRLQEYVVDANRRFDELVGKVRGRRIKNRIYNAGDEVRLLADYLGVDAIAFSRLSITITPAGKAIMSALTGGSTSGAYSSLGVVDGASADLEAMSNSVAVVMPGDKTTAELHDIVATLGERAIDGFPDADPERRRDTATDEDVLSDIESLLAQ